MITIMIKERYCSFELSKLLKEKGFDVECDYYYFLFNEGMMSGYKEFCHKNHNEEKEKYSAPTHQMARDWLREKGFHIEIYANASGYRFIIGKIPPYGTDLVCDIEGNNDGGAWDDYGDCIESAIKYCLTKLI